MCQINQTYISHLRCFITILFLKRAQEFLLIIKNFHWYGAHVSVSSLLHLPTLENLITLHCQLSFQESQQIIMQSVHAVQITWHSGSPPVRGEIIRTLWGCEHLKWIQILCSSNATIWGSSGNMQIFLELQSWLWGWTIIFWQLFPFRYYT